MPTVEERKFELRQNFIYVDDKKLNNNDKVEIICDTCGISVLKEVKRFKKFYKEYKKCFCQKHQTEYVHMKNYGVKNCMMNKNIQKKAQKTQKLNNKGKLAFNTKKRDNTMLDRYGVLYSGQSKKLLKKAQDTNLNKYGNICSLGNYKVREYSKQTKKEIYGDENYNNLEKAKQTNLERYGVMYSLQSEEVKEKSKNTLMKKYGVDHPSKIDGMQEKITNIFMNRYGVKRPAQLYEIKEKIMLTREKNNSNNKCKWYDIKGQKVQGKFELKVANFLIENNINFIAHKGLKFIKYIKKDLSNGLYAPDFYLPCYNIYLEPHAKYYWSEDFEWKMKEVKKQVNILCFDENYDLCDIYKYIQDKEL